jgi:hypothetical protein
MRQFELWPRPSSGAGASILFRGHRRGQLLPRCRPNAELFILRDASGQTTLPNIEPTAKLAAIIAILIAAGILLHPARISGAPLPLILAPATAETLRKNALYGGNCSAQNDL